MQIPGIYPGNVNKNENLVRTLRHDDMERYSAVPRTVMINQWAEDLRWIIVDSTYPVQIDRRLQLLNEKYDMVIDRLPGEDVRAAEQELLDTVVDYQLTAYPDYFKRNGNIITSPLTGLAVDIGADGADRLAAIAVLASEDMLLLLPEKRSVEGKAVYVLKAGVLLFPNEWSLRSHYHKPEPPPGELNAMEAWHEARQRSHSAARLGKTPHEIHDGRVSHYMEHFATRADMFFAQMSPGMHAWRRNWGIRMTDELFLHSDALPAGLPALTPENWERYGYLRSEHEVFTKLPKTGAVVFSIKTYLWKLSELVKNPVAMNALIVAHDNLAPKMFEYRKESLPSFRRFLERHRSRPVSLG